MPDSVNKLSQSARNKEIEIDSWDDINENPFICFSSSNSSFNKEPSLARTSDSTEISETVTSDIENRDFVKTNKTIINSEGFIISYDTPNTICLNNPELLSEETLEASNRENLNFPENCDLSNKKCNKIICYKNLHADEVKVTAAANENLSSDSVASVEAVKNLNLENMSMLSIVRSNFEQLNKKTTICTLCKKTFNNYGSVRNFVAHLKKQHPDSLAACTPAEREGDSRKNKELNELHFVHNTKINNNNNNNDPNLQKFGSGKVSRRRKIVITPKRMLPIQSKNVDFQNKSIHLLAPLKKTVCEVSDIASSEILNHEHVDKNFHSKGMVKHSRVIEKDLKSSCLENDLDEISPEVSIAKAASACLQNNPFLQSHFLKKNDFISKCQLCSALVRNSGSSNSLILHLKNQHPNILVKDNVRTGKSLLRRKSRKGKIKIVPKISYDKPSEDRSLDAVKSATEELEMTSEESSNCNRKHSFVWKYFTVKDNLFSTCLLCSVDLKNCRTTSCLITHLLKRHPGIIPERLISKKSDKMSKLLDRLSIDGKISLTEQYFKRKDKKTSTCILCKRDYVDFGRIGSLVEHLKRRHLDDKFEYCVNKINKKEELKCVKNISDDVSEIKENNISCSSAKKVSGKDVKVGSDSVFTSLDSGEVSDFSSNSDKYQENNKELCLGNNSFVWRYYEQKSKGHSVCLLCGHEFKRNGWSTGLLIYHLKKKHSNIILDKTPTNKERSTIWNFFLKTDCTTCKCLICNNDLQYNGKVSFLKSHMIDVHSGLVGGKSNTGNKTIRRNRSSVWDHFTKQDSKTSICSLCGLALRNAGSTSILKNHLKSRHQIVLSGVNRATSQPTEKEKNNEWESCIKIQVVHNQQVKQSSRKQSLIWQYYTKKTSTVSECLICHRDVKYLGKVGILRAHLRCIHNIILPENLFADPDSSVITKNKIRKNRSIVWDYFKKNSDETVMCLLCSRIFRNGSTTGCLIGHLRRLHPVVLGMSFRYENNDKTSGISPLSRDDANAINDGLFAKNNVLSVPEVGLPVDIPVSNDITAMPPDTITTLHDETAENIIPVLNDETPFDMIRLQNESSTVNTIALPDGTSMNIITIPENKIPVGSISVTNNDLHVSSLSLPSGSTEVIVNSDIIDENNLPIHDGSVTYSTTDVCPEMTINNNDGMFTEVISQHETPLGTVTIHSNAHDESQVYTISISSCAGTYSEFHCPEIETNNGNSLLLQSEPAVEPNKELENHLAKPNSKKASFVWKYFTKKSYVTSTCNICLRDYKNYGSTRNLMEHLKRIHPNIFAEIPIPDKIRMSLSKKVNNGESKRNAKNRSLLWVFFVKKNQRTAVCSMCQLECKREKKVLEEHLESTHQVILSGTELKKQDRSNRSIVWTYFVKKDERSSTCSLCNLDYNHTCTTNLMDHLQRKHPFILYQHGLYDQIQGEYTDGIEISYMDEVEIAQGENLPLTEATLQPLADNLPLEENEFVASTEPVTSCITIPLPVEHDIPNMQLPSVDEVSLEAITEETVQLSCDVHTIKHELDPTTCDDELKEFQLENQKKRRKLSTVWEYFTKHNDKVSICNKCGLCILNHRKIKILIQHLKSHHNIELEYEVKNILRRKHSRVWLYFSRKDDKTSTCSLCKADFNHSSTRNLMSHLRRRHPEKIVRTIGSPSQMPTKRIYNKTSSVWEHFTRKDCRTSVCNLCSRSFNNYRSTTSLIMHLKRIHSIQTKARNSTAIWKYFTKKDRGAVCSLCKHDFNKGYSVTNLINHLKTSHEISLAIATDDKKSASDGSADNASSLEKSIDCSIEDSADKPVEVELIEQANGKKSPKKRSVVWDFFFKKDNRTATCIQCNVDVKHEGTGNLLFHMRKNHPGLLPDRKRSQVNKGSSVVWQYFTKKDKLVSSCVLCKRDFKNYGTTGTMLRHLKRVHNLDISKKSVQGSSDTN